MQNKGQYANIPASRLYPLQSVLFIMAYILVYSVFLQLEASSTYKFP